jgi:hypothetical protein
MLPTPLTRPKPDSPTCVALRLPAARTVGTLPPHLSCACVARPVPATTSCAAFAGGLSFPQPNPHACRTALDLPRQIEELEKKLETERRCAPHPAVPRACGPACTCCADTPSRARPARPAPACPPTPTPTPSDTTAPHPHLRAVIRAQEAAGDRDPAHGDPGGRQAGRGQVTTADDETMRWTSCSTPPSLR